MKPEQFQELQVGLRRNGYELIMCPEKDTWILYGNFELELPNQAFHDSDITIVNSVIDRFSRYQMKEKLRNLRKFILMYFR